MKVRSWIPGIAAAVLLAGCAQAPAPVSAPIETTPAAAAECTPEPRQGKDRIDLVVNGLAIGSLPAQDCTVKAVDGNNLILRVYPSKGIGLPVQTPTGEGLWDYFTDEAQLMVPAFGVEPGGRTTIKLNLTAQGMGEFTYTFVARAATTYTLESAAVRTGPWTPVAGEFIPPEHRWLKFAYSAPLGQGVRPELSLLGPVEWEGDRTAYLELKGAPAVFTVNGGRDYGGFPARGPMPIGGFLFRSEKPQLVRVTPGGQLKPVYTLKGLPERMYTAEGKFYYQDTRGNGYTVDLATGAESVGPIIVGAHGFGETYVQSPVSPLLADVVLPGGPDVREDRIDPADLVIMDLAQKELDRVKSFVQVHRIVPGCSAGHPTLAWRPDGGALAAISAATREKLQLVMYDLATKERKVLAEKPGDPSGSYAGISWSPDGRYVTFGEHLLDTQTGKFITGGISPNVRWNAAGTHLLEKRFSPFVRWNETSLIEAASGKRTTLGYGDTLGWTSTGEAVVVLWETARQIPGPGKGCLP